MPQNHWFLQLLLIFALTLLLFLALRWPAAVSLVFFSAEAEGESTPAPIVPGPTPAPVVPESSAGRFFVCVLLRRDGDTENKTTKILCNLNVILEYKKYYYTAIAEC